MSKLRQTPSQTVGPFFAYALTPEQYGYDFKSIADGNLIEGDVPGQRIRIEGRVLDGNGDLVPDAMIEIWQADSEGCYGSAAFSGWGRTVADFETGLYRFETIKPGVVAFSDGRPQAPHVSFSIFARGINIHLQTRMYFPEEVAANAADPALTAVAKPDLIETLIARKEERGNETIYRFDIHLQGDRETVFFDF